MENGNRTEWNRTGNKTEWDGNRADFNANCIFAPFTWPLTVCSTRFFNAFLNVSFVSDPISAYTWRHILLVNSFKTGLDS